MQEYMTHSREETVALGRTLAPTLAPGTLIAFTGGLARAKPPSARVWRKVWAAQTRYPAPPLPSSTITAAPVLWLI